MQHRALSARTCSRRVAPATMLVGLAAAILASAISCQRVPPPPAHSSAASERWRTRSATTGYNTSHGSAAELEGPTAFECQWTDEPITIDGRADEPAWKRAIPIENFRIPWEVGAARQAHSATKARLLWDREYLYYFAEMQDTDLYADVKEHNGTIWMNDAFELFFKPADEKPGYYEFEVSPANATMEMFLPARNAGGWVRFRNAAKIEMTTAVALRGTLNHWQDKDEGWSVEGRIRWRDLAPTGGRPNVGETWKFALCRVDMSVGDPGTEMTTCAPLTQLNFHRYEDYATLKFVKNDAGPTTEPAAQGSPAERKDEPTRGEAHPYGIARRVAWTTSRVIGSPDPPLPYKVAKAFPNLKVRQPVCVLPEPGTNDYLLLQHLGIWSGPGRLLRFKNDPAVDTTQTLLDLNRLTYGMTLHPDFIHNGYLYIISDGPTGAPRRQDRISRFTVDRKAPYGIDPASELVILEWDSNGHDGGDLGFGPDGCLYHASGDGSSDSDANDRGQDLSQLNSKMIRIDVDHPGADKPYSIPADNPFIGVPGARPETWAYGFRNPFRLAFDRKTGDLWVGQNGQDLYEQVYFVRKGENYGWSRYEGGHPFQLQRKAGPTPVTPPTVEHPHSEMRSLTGGVVYRGGKLPDLDGAFIYGDWSTGRIWGVKHDGTRVTWHHELARTSLQITGFRETPEGELLVIDHGGYLYKLQPAPAEQPVVRRSAFPQKLSETGLFVSTNQNAPEPALIPYDVNAPLWSDGAAKERFIAIPGVGQATVSTSRGWDFPEGTVLVKTFSLEAEPGNAGSQRRIETRLFTKQQGQWAGYSYAWDDAQSDATLVGPAGLDRDYAIGAGFPDRAVSTAPASAPAARVQTWHFPSRAECMTCHSRASNFVLGLSTLQLNKQHDYGNGVKDNQLRTFEHLGLLRVDYMSHVREEIRRELLDGGKDDPEADRLMWEAVATRGQREPGPADASTLLAFDPDHTPALVDPYDEKAPLDLRARSYLHANCAICHVEAGGGNGLMSLEYGVAPEKCRLIDAAPQHEAFGMLGAKIIAPGRADSSVLLHRISVRGPGQMPPLATSMTDPRAVQLLTDWVRAMPQGAAAGNNGVDKPQ